MRDKNTFLKILITLAVTLLIIAGVLFAVEIKDGITPREIQTTENADADEAKKTEEKEEKPSDVLFFASDYQKEEGWKAPADTLRSILGAISTDGKVITNVVYCGDYTNDAIFHDYQISPDDSINEIREIVASECHSVNQDSLVFEQGNHDQLTDAITPSGLHEYDNYLIYVLNTQYDFPWKQGRDTEFKARVIGASEDMKKCFDELIAAGETRPVFVAGHVPLHFTARTSSRHSTGDNMYAKYIFDVVNNSADSLDIIYMYGHNHSKGWDCYLGGSCTFVEAGDTLLVPDAGDNTVNTDNFTVETVKFTYLNAGYTGYYMNCGPEELWNNTSDEFAAADDTLTGTLCEIMPSKIVISRYSAEGPHPLRWDGEANPYKDHIDSDLIESSYYSTRKEGPVEILRRQASKQE